MQLHDTALSAVVDTVNSIKERMLEARKYAQLTNHNFAALHPPPVEVPQVIVKPQ